jgi:UrcA family protein
MSRSILAVAVLCGVAVVVPQAPAASQADTAITVTGPKRGTTGEPANGVRQRTRVTTSVSVDFADLDLRTDYGRWVLDQRLRIAADAACDRIDDIDPPGGPGGGSLDTGNCRSIALRDAMPQARRAILDAG